MSATGRGDNTRQDGDFYRTPEWCVEWIARQAEVRAALEGSVLDLGCGDGAIGRGLVAAGCAPVRLCGVDNNLSLVDACRAATVYTEVAHADAREIAHTPVPERFDACIGNPPYSNALTFCNVAISVARISVQLLRLSFLASRKRHAWWQRNPADVYVLSRRPSFTGRGTDATDYAWFVWGPGPRGRVTVLP